MAPVPMKDECERRESVCQCGGERKEGVLAEKDLTYLIAIVPVFFNRVMNS